MTIIEESIAAGRHGAGAVAESLHPDPQVDLVWVLEISKPIPSDTPPLRRPYLPIFPIQFHPLGTKQTFKYMSLGVCGCV